MLSVRHGCEQLSRVVTVELCEIWPGSPTVASVHV
jgi:hypothetical protein